MHPIRRLRELGQSVWLDYIDRRLLTSGELDRLIDVDGLSGLTSNPTIFQKAIAASADYDAFIERASVSDDVGAIFERLQIQDVTAACDRFLPLFEETAGADGFVSIEVSPSLARDAQASTDQARRLWSAVSRPNLLIKIPGTLEGLTAIQQCLTEGINVNVTLLFSVSRYLEVWDAYVEALESRLSRGLPIDRVASVASFFVSRVDTKVDRMLDAFGGSKAECARALRGKIAIANARLAYEEWQCAVETERWRALQSKGARPQRLLWGSTSSKDPQYVDTYYADALVAPYTIDTMPLDTLRAYIDHGAPASLLAAQPDPQQAIEGLSSLGIDLGRVTDELEFEGVHSFEESFQKALVTIAGKRRLLKSA